MTNQHKTWRDPSLESHPRDQSSEEIKQHTTTAPILLFTSTDMLDFLDFVTDRGGDPGKIKESQRRRFASESVVDEVLELFEDARRGTAWLVVLRNFVSD
jgi:hypothetical protein